MLGWLLTKVGLREKPLPDRAPAGEKPRSPQWPKVRKAFLVLHPACAACGGAEKLQVHHLKPFHLFPELELSPANLLPLCEAPGRECHLKIGHKPGDWHKYNPNAVTDAAAELERRKATHEHR